MDDKKSIDLKTLRDEARAFHASMARELGVDSTIANLPESSRGLMSMFQQGWEEVLDEMNEIEGFPVKMVMQLEMGGAACTNAAGQPIALDGMWADAMNAGAMSGARTAGYHTRWAVHRETSQALGGGVGGSVAGSAW